MLFPIGGISGSWENGSLRSETEMALDELRISPHTQQQKGYRRLWPEKEGTSYNTLPWPDWVG